MERLAALAVYIAPWAVGTGAMGVLTDKACFCWFGVCVVVVQMASGTKCLAVLSQVNWFG